MLEVKMNVPLTTDVIEDIIFCKLAFDIETWIKRGDVAQVFQDCIKTGIKPNQAKLGIIMFMPEIDSFALEEKSKKVREELFPAAYVRNIIMENKTVTVGAEDADNS